MFCFISLFNWIFDNLYSLTWSETLIQSRQGNDIESCHEAALLRQHRCFETSHCSHLEPFELHIEEKGNYNKKYIKKGH